MGATGWTWTSERTLRLRFTGATDAEALGAVHRAFRALRADPVPGQVDLTPSHDALQITIDPLRADPALAESRARDTAEACATPGEGSMTGRRVVVPVCFDPGFGPDLDDVRAPSGWSRDRAVRALAGARLTVAFLGFSPGFPYIDGLPDALEAPRLGTPRREVPAGSVAIAGRRLGIYPQATPGGWRLIGRSPLILFDPSRAEAALLAPGDEVTLRPIDRAEFARIADGGEP